MADPLARKTQLLRRARPADSRMSPDADELDYDRLRRCRLEFARQRVVRLGPGEQLSRSAFPWEVAILFVIAGEIVVETAGVRFVFDEGAALTLTGLIGSRVLNVTPRRAELLAIWKSG
jgi:hypothetical protein